MESVWHLDLVGRVMKRIKILMLTVSLSLTGTHRILMDLIEGLDREKFEILVAFKPEFPGSGNELIPEIRELNSQIFRLRGRHLYDLKGLWDLHKIVSKHYVDIIHCWDSFSIMGRFLGRINNAKVIDTIGNAPVKVYWKEYISRKISSIFLDGIIFQSNGSQYLTHQYGPDNLRRCMEKVIYNSINLEKVPHYQSEEKRAIREKYGLQESDIILSNLGMYNIQKSQEYIINAMPEILKTYSNVKLLLIGWGEREKILKQQIQSLNLVDRVTLTGQKRRAEVFDLLAITDIYVTSSLWEGLPIAILEAMAFGLPIIGTNVVGNQEVILDKQTGLLVPSRDSLALAKAVCNLISIPAKKSMIGKAGRIRAQKLFNPEIFIKKHEDFYRQILRH